MRREVGEHIKIRGFTVFPKLIEGTLTQHTAIADAWCVALGETDQTRRLEAAIAIAPKQKAPQLAELREWLSERVPQYMIPIAFYLLPENRPITATSGKADERAIAKLFETLPPLNSHSEISAAATNLTPAEVKLADAWREVLELKLPQLTSTDSFFAYGGSLQFVKLATLLTKEYNLEVQVGSLLKSPTLLGMATLITEGVERAAFNAEKEADRYPLTTYSRNRPTTQSSTRRPSCFIPQQVEQDGPSYWSDWLCWRLPVAALSALPDVTGHLHRRRTISLPHSAASLTPCVSVALIRTASLAS